MVLGVLGVGVDLAGLGQLEARLLSRSDDDVGGHIAVPGAFDLGPRVRAMLFHGEHAARLEDGVEVGQGLVEHALAPVPVVEVTGRQHHVGRAGLAQGARHRAEARILDVAEHRGVGIFGGEGFATTAARLADIGIVQIGDAGHIGPVGRLGVGRQDLGPIATAGRDLDHRLAGLEPPEDKAVIGVARSVAGLMGFAPLGSGHGLAQGGVFGVGRRTENQRAQGASDKGGELVVKHGLELRQVVEEATLEAWAHVARVGGEQGLETCDRPPQIHGRRRWMSGPSDRRRGHSGSPQVDNRNLA